MLSRTLLIAAGLVASALAAPTATVVIEASHGGAGNDLTNTTITVEINGIYHNTTTLAEVSTLYLTGSSGVPLNSITCTPFSHADGTGVSGLAFNSSSPSLLSTNTVQLGSIVCITTSITQSPLQPPGVGSQSSSGVKTSTKLVTSTPSPHVVHSTVTSVTAASATPHSSSSSSVAAAQTGNAASGLYLSPELFGGLALAGFGVAFAL